jgi:hypothetical protein
MSGIRVVKHAGWYDDGNQHRLRVGVWTLSKKSDEIDSFSIDMRRQPGQIRLLAIPCQSRVDLFQVWKRGLGTWDGHRVSCGG